MHPVVSTALSRARARWRLADAGSGRVAPFIETAPQPRLADRESHGIRLRRLGPSDAHHMADLLERMSPDSRYQRYFRLVSRLAPSDLARLVAVGHGHLAVGAFDGETLVGAAQYFRSAERPDHGEVAVEVADSHHRRRVATRLLHELARLAADGGITHLTATVLAENRAVLALIRGSGWQVAMTLDGPYVDVVVTLAHTVSGRHREEEERREERQVHARL